jgi:ABC-type multidrug transport system fused ATPase/permease subunit
LIFRLYDPLEGEIKLDGENIRNLKFEFRESMTFVSQLPYIFNGTVLENLQYAHPACTQEEIEYFTKAFGLHDVIMELPQKYDTNVG